MTEYAVVKHFMNYAKASLLIVTNLDTGDSLQNCCIMVLAVIVDVKHVVLQNLNQHHLYNYNNELENTVV